MIFRVMEDLIYLIREHIDYCPAVTADTRLNDLYPAADADLYFCEVMMAVEEEYGITVSEEAARGIATVRDLYNLIQQLQR